MRTILTLSGLLYRLYLVKEVLFSNKLPIPQNEAAMRDGLFNKLPDWALSFGNSNVFDLMSSLGIETNTVSPAIGAMLKKNARNCNQADANPSENDVLHLLHNLVLNKKPILVVEVGIYHGAGTIAILSALEVLKTDYKFLAIDLNEINISKTKQTIEQAGLPLDSVTFLKGASEVILADLLQQHTKVDFCFLDADHTQQGVEQDLRCIKGLMAPSGILVMHDSQCWNGVRQGSNKLFFDNAKQIYCLSTSHGSGVSVATGF